MSLLLFPKTHLHSLVYVVADKPTKSNLSEKVPLVGTKSYKTFLSWLADMDIDITRVRMYNQCDNPFPGFSADSLNRAIEADHTKVIALGNNAMNYLLKVGVEEFFLLPHPSGRNLKLNDPKFVKATLSQCRRYIYEGVKEKPIEVEKDYKEEQTLLPEG